MKPSQKSFQLSGSSLPTDGAGGGVSVTPPAREAPQDLGFGDVVTRQSRQRFLNPDGTFNVRRTGLNFWSSLNFYHALLTISWARFISLVALSYVLINLVFAGLFVLCGPDALAYSTEVAVGRFWQAFFFSVQTFATIGYGHINPTGFVANIIVVAESLVALLAFALVTGVVFARFSRPIAKFIFSRRSVIAPYGDGTALMFRITNAQRNQIIELECQLMFARMVEEHGERVRRFDELALEREHVAFFPLHWTIVHPINEESPLHGLTQEDLQAMDAELLVLLTGINETFMQTVHTRTSYKANEVVWNARFANIFNPPDKNGRITIDVRRLHNIELLK